MDLPVIHYPYLTMSVFLFLSAMVGYAVFGNHRKPMFVSGLLSLPCCATTIFFVPEYWQPKRLFNPLLGIEDVLFSFSTGIIAWIFVAARFREATVDMAIHSVLKRCLKLIGLGILVTCIMLQLPLMVMNQAFIGIFIVGCFLCIRKSGMVGTAVLSGILFAGFYSLVLLLFFWIFPSYSLQWNHANLSGITLLGFPVEETVWAFEFGLCWVLVIAYVFNLSVNFQKKTEGVELVFVQKV